MLESYRAVPEPCTTMKVVVLPDIQKEEGMDNDILKFRIEFPVEYTEIKHERVNINFTENLNMKLSCRNLPGKVCGEILVVT